VAREQRRVGGLLWDPAEVSIEFLNCPTKSLNSGTAPMTRDVGSAAKSWGRERPDRLPPTVRRRDPALWRTNQPFPCSILGAARG